MYVGGEQIVLLNYWITDQYLQILLRRLQHSSIISFSPLPLLKPLIIIISFTLRAILKAEVKIHEKD
jgi:hypothetical protein